MFKKIVPGTGKIYQEDFLKAFILKRSRKVAMSGPFLRALNT